VNTQAPVANFVPLTEAQIAAKQEVAKFTEGKSPVATTSRYALDTLSGYSGLGYNSGELERAMSAEKAAKSDYAFITGAAKRGVEKAATTVAVGLTAVNAPIVLPVAFVGTVATRMVMNNESASAAIKGTVTAVTDYARSFLSTADAATTKPTTLMDTLPKTPDGSLTPQSERVLQLVNEQAQKQADAAPNIGH
jgi:hypothetical protein